MISDTVEHFTKFAKKYEKINIMVSRYSVILFFIALLAGCDQISQRLGLEDPAKKEAALEADGKAVGSACRQSGRAIEDCYSIYSWLPRSAIFAGWKEMDAYMRENQLETVAPQLPPPEPPPSKKKKKAVVSEEAPADSGKEGDKPEKEDKADKGGSKAEKADAKH